jgi:hypothetical protein
MQHQVIWIASSATIDQHGPRKGGVSIIRRLTIRIINITNQLPPRQQVEFMKGLERLDELLGLYQDDRDPDSSGLTSRFCIQHQVIWR